MTTPLPEPDINTASHIHQRIIGHFTRQVAAYGAEKDAQWSALLESMTAERDDALYAGRLVVQRCDRLVTERDALKADAERYRWLRDVGDATWTPLANRRRVNFTHEIDGYIDAAMKGKS